MCLYSYNQFHSKLHVYLNPQVNTSQHTCLSQWIKIKCVRLGFRLQETNAIYFLGRNTYSKEFVGTNSDITYKVSTRVTSNEHAQFSTYFKTVLRTHHLLRAKTWSPHKFPPWPVGRLYLEMMS